MHEVSRHGRDPKLLVPSGGRIMLEIVDAGAEKKNIAATAQARSSKSTSSLGEHSIL
jgi:hypothetical protein